MNIPPEVLNCFFDEASDHQQAAFLKIGSKGTLEDWGGSPATFSLPELSADMNVGDLPFASAFPDNPGERIIIEAMHLSPSVIANVHLYRTEEAVWVLLMNQTGQELRVQHLQQKLNDLALLYEELTDQTPEPALADALCMLHFTVLERQESGCFRLVGIAPPQLSRIYPELFQRPDQLYPGRRFSFLDNFLIDAEAFWESHTTGRLRSGNWQPEEYPDGGVYLEASAVSVGERKLLLIRIRQIEDLFEHQLIQKARETTLSYNQLVRENQKKEILLHCIVHDLKGPLTSMVGALSCLDASSELDNDAREFARIGMESTLR